MKSYVNEKQANEEQSNGVRPLIVDFFQSKAISSADLSSTQLGKTQKYIPIKSSHVFHSSIP